MCEGTQVESPLPYAEAGSGPPILLIHGQLSAPSLWTDVALLLSARFRVICCDLRRGAGPRTAHGMGDSRTNRLIALMNRLDLPSVHLVAHGSGCASATALAARVCERIRSVAVVDPVVARTDATSAVQVGWHLENLLQWLAVAYGNAVRAPQHVATIQAIVAQQTHAHLCEAPSLFPPADPAFGASAAGSSITCPVLVITGAHSSVECKATVGGLFGGVRNLQWAQVPGDERHSPRGAPSATARLLADFLTANG